jgi:NRPS condensation-like uncharacterized protein
MNSTTSSQSVSHLGKHRSSKPTTINRRLGATENIYYFLDQLYCLNFIIFVEITGSLQIDQINEALKAVQAEQPLLRARIALIDGHYWFKPVATKDFPLKAQTGPLMGWRNQVAAQLDTPFVDDAPLARFFWFDGHGKKAVAAMAFHHSIADGKSGMDVFIEVLRRAGGEDSPLRYRRAHPSAQDLDLIKSKTAWQSSLQRLKYWLKQGRSVLKFPKQLPGFDMSIKAERDIKIIPFQVSATSSAALLDACRAHGTTVHGALGAAQILALNDEFDTAEDRYLALNSLADLRGVLKGDLTEFDLGLYIATLTTVHEVAAEPDFWALAIDIRSQLQSILQSGDADLVHSIYRDDTLFPRNETGARMVHAMVALAPPSSMLTNIGKVDKLTLANGTSVDSVAFAVTGPTLHPICITATSYADRMYMNLVYDVLKLSESQARRIAKSVRRYLKIAAGT